MIKPIPAPTAQLAITCGQVLRTQPVGVDLVCTLEAGAARVLVAIPGTGLGFRLEFSRAELAALMDELVDLADTCEGQADELQGELSYGGSEC